jgi:hypothetical protein
VPLAHGWDTLASDLLSGSWRAGWVILRSADDQSLVRHHGCATRRHVTGWDERAHPRSPRRPGEAGGSPAPEVGRSGGSSPDDVPTGRRQRPGRASEAERRRETEPVVEAPRSVASPDAGGCGLSRRSSSVCDGGRLVRLAGGAAWRVAVPRGDAAGVKLGADPAYRCMVNVGSVPAVPGGPEGLGAGAPSAVAAGAWRRDRSTPRSGKPATWGRVPANGRHAVRVGGRR